MFEKEAEEYLGNFADCANCKERWSICADSLDEYCLVNGCCCAIPKEQDIYIAGAKLGYNKANEWHYVKDGDLPKDDIKLAIIEIDDCGYLLCNYRNGFWYDANSGATCAEWITNNIIAWKEIVPPSEPNSI